MKGDLPELVIFEPPRDESLGYVGRFMTEGISVFPLCFHPPIFPIETNPLIPEAIFTQTGSVEDRPVKQFSGAIVFVLEAAEVCEHVPKPGDTNAHPGMVIKHTWRRTVEPHDHEFLRALEAPTAKGSAFDQMKKVLEWLHLVPMVPGAKIEVRFGHRGDLMPLIEATADVRFGQVALSHLVNREYRQAMEEHMRELAEFEASASKQFNDWLRGLRRLPSWLKPDALEPPPEPVKRKTPTLSLPDIWEKNPTVGDVLHELKRIMASLLYRLERRKAIAKRMIEAGVQPAPSRGGHTVAMEGDEAEHATTRRLMRPGETVLDSSDGPPPMPDHLRDSGRTLIPEDLTAIAADDMMELPRRSRTRPPSVRSARIDHSAPAPPVDLLALSRPNPGDKDNND